MSKRKVEDLVTKNLNGEHSVKKEKKENIKTTKTINNDIDNSDKLQLSESKNNGVKVKETTKINGKKCSTDKTSTSKKSGTKRKREEEEVAEDKKNGNVEVPKTKRILKKRISKNECLCAPAENQQPLQKAEDTDARIQVEEWRLHKFQSPIELNHDESIHHDHFEPLEFHGHWDDSGEATFTNNGFTATLRFFNRELPVLKGGPLHEDEYVFEQLHFHWSEDDHSGCEHIFEGRAYSMEAHAVHFNQKYKDFKEALDKPDGLSVVAFFLQATDNEDNPCFNKLATAVKDIIKINTTTNVPADCLTWFKEEAQCKGYYTYQGSLTTEPYTESVTWILYPQPIHVSREQVASFRSLKSTPCEKHNIKQNVRPIQTPPEHKKLNVLYARSHRPSTSE